MKKEETPLSNLNLILKNINKRFYIITHDNLLWGKRGEIVELLKDYPKQGRSEWLSVSGVVYHPYCDLQFCLEQKSVKPLKIHLKKQTK